jgi:exonuclease III
MNSYDKLNLTITAINVNSMNVSTMNSRNSKTLLKIEAITGKKSDIILLSDVRAKDKGDELKRLFGLTRNGSYKLYLNSTKESRGVGIAIKRNIFHEIISTTIDNVNENYLILDMNIKNVRVKIGCIYGPNSNSPAFFTDIRMKLGRGGGDFIIGGDMNTIMSMDGGGDNLDQIGRGRVPNIQNSRELNNWVRDGFAVEPFRTLYPEQLETSYIPFRDRVVRGPNLGVQVNRTRLDFYMCSPNLLDRITGIRYEDRLGADFDHKEVTMKIGKTKNHGKVTLHDITLEDSICIPLGRWAVFDTINNHLTVRDEQLTATLVQYDLLIRE